MSFRLMIVDINSKGWAEACSGMELVGHTSVPFNTRQYHFVPTIADQIRALTEDSVDCIVIGNNLKVGIQYAECVPEVLRSRVLVVSNSLLSEAERYPYEEIGITQFCLRDQLVAKVGEKQRAAI